MIKKKNRFTLLILFPILLVLLSSCARDPDEIPVSEETLNALLAANPLVYTDEMEETYFGTRATLATPVAPRPYQIGDQELFWIDRDTMSDDNEQATMTLRYMNDVVYMWVEDGITWNGGHPIKDADLERYAGLFANEIYPTTRSVFGSEPNPGVDNDLHLHLVHYQSHNPQIAGYYGANDRLPVEVFPFSNQKETIFFDAPSYNPNDSSYRAALAHEFVHMIHYNKNMAGETAWIAEGLAQLGEELNGYPSWNDEDFADNPDVQLNAHRYYPLDEWPAHYGADHAFMSYLYARFGPDFIQDVVETDTNGLRTIQRALVKYAAGATFESVFADWTVANHLEENPGEILTPYSMVALESTYFDSYPQMVKESVYQFASDNYVLMPNGQKELTIEFDGQASVKVIPTNARGGEAMWWAGRLGGVSILTRQVDLSQEDQATLKFSTWYDLYDLYNFCHVLVSTDGGDTWDALKGKHTTDENHHRSYGFTCDSGIGCEMEDGNPKWVNESMDLSEYAGKEILLRFLCFSGTQNHGFAIDNIEIPEIKFKDNAESEAGGWEAIGFTRMDNRVPQKFIVQVIEFGPTTRTVKMDLDGENQGSHPIRGFGESISKVVVVVSGATPFTWEKADYDLEVR